MSLTLPDYHDHNSPLHNGTNEEGNGREFGWASRIAVVLEPAIIPVLPYHTLWLHSWDTFSILTISEEVSARITPDWLQSSNFWASQAILWLQPTWRSGVFVLLAVIGNTNGWALDHKFFSAGTCWWLVLCRNLWNVFNPEVDVLKWYQTSAYIRNKTTENCIGEIVINWRVVACTRSNTS